MKSYLALLLAAMLCILTSSAPAQVSNPMDYLNSISIEYEKMSQDMMSYTSAAAHGKSARKVDKRRIELLRQLKESERKIRMMKPFNEDHALRDSISSYLRICSIVLNEDYAKLLDMEDIAEQSYDAMEAYLLAKEKANEKADHAQSVAHDQYTLFAKANNITLLENNSKLSQKMKMAGKVNKYYDTIYLLFFKSYKNEAYLLDAMSRADVNAIEQTAGNLLTSTSEDIIKLGQVAPFNGDNSLKTACQRTLAFYKAEATKTTQIVDFHLQKEKFEKIRTAFEAKREKDRTKADVDLYNKSVNEFNASLNKVNRVNDELNKSRNTLIANWNKASDSFLDRHTPKYK